MAASRPQGPRAGHDILMQIAGRLARIAAGLGLMVLLWSYFFYSHRGAHPPQVPVAGAPDEPAKKDAPAPAEKDGPTAEPAGSVEQRTAFTAEETTRSIAKAEQGRVVQRANEAKLILEEARRLASRFDSTLAAMKDDDQGRRVASRPELLGRYRALLASERSPAGRIDAALADVDALVRPMRRALSDPDDITMPNEPIRQELPEMRSLAGMLREEYAKLDPELDALLEDIRSITDASAETLAAVIARAEAAEAREASRLSSEAMEAARKEAAEARANAEAEAIRLVGEAEANEILAKARQRKEAVDAALAEEVRVAEEARLRRKARTAEVAHHLGAFFAVGAKQPREIQGTFLALEMTAEPGPVSLTRLKTLGALDEGVEGLRRLNWIAADWQSERPRWSYPLNPAEWSPEALAFIRRSQALLVELGPALVEEGLLAP